MVKKNIKSYVRDTKSYERDTKSYVRDTKSYVRDTKSYVRLTKSYVRDTKSYVRDTKSYVRDTKSYVRYTISYVRLTKSYVRDTKSYVRDTNSYVRDTISYVRLTNSYVRDTKSYVRLTYSGAGKLKELPRVNRAQGPVEDQKSQLLSFSEILHLNFAVFLSKFIKMYILLNFIQYYKKVLGRNHTFYHYTLWKMEQFFKSISPSPLDTGISDYHDFIFIKEVHTTNGDLYLGGGGNVIHDFWYLGRGE